MAKRKIIKIDEEKCNGCGLCIPNCPEGALQIIDGKVRLISDLFCDGLGACIGHCPEGVITTEEREAEEYNEKRVMANIIKQGTNVIKAHLEHLKEHGQHEYLKEAMDYLKEKGGGACPGSKMMDFRDQRPKTDLSRAKSREDQRLKTKDQRERSEAKPPRRGLTTKRESELSQWPVQIMLVPPQAPYFKDADLLIAADCVPFAYASFHEGLLRGRILLVGCPKLDDVEFYKEKITQIISKNDIKSMTYAHMEVPCCFGLVSIIKEAISVSGKGVPFNEIVISIKGERLK